MQDRDQHIGFMGRQAFDIRNAEAEDQEAILEIFDSRKAYEDKEFVERYLRDFFGQRNCHPQDRLFVGTVEGKVIGITGYCLERLETDEVYWLN